eukprot:8703297-Karenia_brevis.AAC.1
MLETGGNMRQEIAFQKLESSCITSIPSRPLLLLLLIMADLTAGILSSQEVGEASEPTAKRRGVGISKDLEKQSEVMVTLAKLTLSNTLQTRVLRSIVIRNFKLPVESWVVVQCKA